MILPLDVTMPMTFTRERAEAVRKTVPNSEIAAFIVNLTDFMAKTNMSYRETEGVAGFHVHDAATLAYLFYPETLLLRRGEVRVETEGKWTRGRTVMDERHGAKTEANAWVALQVDAADLLSILSEDLKLLCGAE